MGRVDLTSLNLGPEDVILIARCFVATAISTELKSIQYDGAVMGPDGSSLLHLVLQVQVPTHVAVAVMEADPTACTKVNDAGHTPLKDAIDGKQAVLAREMFHRLTPQKQETLKPELRDWFSTGFLDLIGQLVNERKAATIDATLQLTAMLDFNLVNDAFVSQDGFGHLLPLLCHPDIAVYTAAAKAAAVACQNDDCATALIAQARGGFTRRLVDMLILEQGEAQLLAVTALGRVSKNKGRQDVQKVLSKSVGVTELLALLTVSGNATLATVAEDLFKLVTEDLNLSDKDKNNMRDREIQRMFAKPWPSSEFRKYLSSSSWETPSETQRDCDGMDLIGLKVFVEGEGEGTVRKFHKSRVGASDHEIEFVLKGSKKVTLRRKGKTRQKDWLVQSKSAARPKGLVWQQNGGNHTTTKMYTRGASKNDVCMWMYKQKGICRHYAGLFSWIFEQEKADEAAGSVLLKMVTEDAERSLLTAYVPIASHREALLKEVAGLAGFLGRYLLAPGRSMHKSATCALILAEDRQEEDGEDGTLQKVALKCMKNLSQFLTELRVREGLDGGKVVSALRVHVPPGFTHEKMEEVSQGVSDTEPEPETDCFETPHARTTTATLFGVDVLRDETLARDAGKADERLTGQYVIVMECADCDLGGDISHGHYAGRDKLRVRQLLKKIVQSFKYCEEHGIIHGDIKCAMALLLFSEDFHVLEV